MHKLTTKKFIANKDIAKAIHKTGAAISYVKKTNFDEYRILQLGTLCQSLEVTEEDILAIRAFKRYVSTGQ